MVRKKLIGYRTSCAISAESVSTRASRSLRHAAACCLRRLSSSAYATALASARPPSWAMARRSSASEDENCVLPASRFTLRRPRCTPWNSMENARAWRTRLSFEEKVASSPLSGRSASLSASRPAVVEAAGAKETSTASQGKSRWMVRSMAPATSVGDAREVSSSLSLSRARWCGDGSVEGRDPERRRAAMTPTTASPTPMADAKRAASPGAPSPTPAAAPKRTGRPARTAATRVWPAIDADPFKNVFSGSIAPLPPIRPHYSPKVRPPRPVPVPVPESQNFVGATTEVRSEHDPGGPRREGVHAQGVAGVGSLGAGEHLGVLLLRLGPRAKSTYAQRFAAFARRAKVAKGSIEHVCEDPRLEDD